MSHHVREMEDLSKDELTALLALTAGEALVHYGMWFCQGVIGKGLETSLESESAVFERFGVAVLRRVAGHLGLDVRGGAPNVVGDMSQAQLMAFIRDIAKIWLTSDGLWFQEIERRFSMDEAKAVNDSCWALFGPMEAFKLKKFLGLGKPPDIHSPEDPSAPVHTQQALRALEKTLPLRVYSLINPHESEWEDDKTLVWKMLGCRVQEARLRKGLDHYPCKSAGIVEYGRFAEGIHPGIRTECLVCPPDELPEGLACAWRFRFSPLTN